MMLKFQQLRRLVVALSGAHEETLALVPTERARFESLGWAVLITSGMAAVSMWFALASAVGINGIIAVPVALFWGLVIMGIDRWLITSMPADSARKFAMAVPRLALALLLGTLISTPLVLRIFQSEIDAQIAVIQQKSYNTFLQQQQSSQVAAQVATYKGELQQLNTVINSHGASTGNTSSDPQLVAYNNQKTQLESQQNHWITLENKYYTDYTCQKYGGVQCPKKGVGPAAEASYNSYLQAKSQITTLQGEINNVQAEIHQRDNQLNSTSVADEQNRYQEALTQRPLVQNEYNTAVQRQNQLQATYFAQEQASHGILIRLEALSQLSNGNPTVTAARFLLFLLFLVIECLPVTVKLLQQPGLYEEAMAKAKDASRRDVAKYYSGRSRLGGGGFPAGAPSAVLRLRPESEPSIDPIWNKTRALTTAIGDHADDQQTETIHDQYFGWTPGGGAEHGSPGNERPQQGWSGADRWRNHWRDRPDEDEPPQWQPDRQEPVLAEPRGEVPAADPFVAQTRLDLGYPDAGPRADAYQPEGRDDGGLAYPEDGYQDDGYRGDGHLGEDDRDAGWSGHGADGAPDGQQPVPARPDGNGSGIPLSWDDE
jgi:hypothetical protein